MASLQAVALDLGRDRVWLERVEVQTAPWQDREALRARADALGALLRDLDSLPATNDDRKALADTLNRLREILPPSASDIPLLQALGEGELEPTVEAARRYLEAGLLHLEPGE